jgi:LmbE family N-acetylglucosaminyl deacetylase
MQSHLDYVNAILAAMREAPTIPAPKPPFHPPVAEKDAPLALIVSPHPDDEMIVGALPLRMLRQAGMRVTDLAVTLGSDRSRRAGRLAELKNACAYAGFGLEVIGAEGLSGISPALAEDPAALAKAAEPVAEAFARLAPAAVFFPHGGDANKTHMGVSLLAKQALRLAKLSCDVFETEFWSPMEAPNLMVESPAEDVARLIAALSLHAGEVARNPYHVRLPAWMADNVRRGAELVGGQGGRAPDFAFATLYRHLRYGSGEMEEVSSPVFLTEGESPASLNKNGKTFHS